PDINIKWIKFLEVINTEIVNFTQTDDKQIGPWFLGSTDKEIDKNNFTGKVFSFLWFDIFRHEPSAFFKENIKTYDDIKRIYYEADSSSLKNIIKEDIFYK